MLYGSSKIELKQLTAEDKRHLHHLSELSRDLYNLCTAEICCHYEATNQILDYAGLKQAVQGSREYQTITGFYYSVLVTAIADFRKYISTDIYALNKDDRVLKAKNLDKFYPPKLKKELRPIEQLRVMIRDGCICFPKTKETPELRFKLPECYRDKDIRSAFIRPLHRESHWELTIQYPLNTYTHDLDYDKAIGIDLGMVNFATVVNSDTLDCFIIDGRRLKSLLQGYCKYLAKLRHLGGSYDTKRIASLRQKTYNRLNAFVGKASAYIIKYCIENKIGKVCLGWGEHFQGQKSLGINSQLFSLFPYARFKNSLQHQCQRHGIHFVLIDETYTSLASALDSDAMPEHVTRAAQQFSGKRVKRGLYLTGDGIKVNADENAAINILRKGSVNIPKLWEQHGRGLVSPDRVSVF